jgi:hypothetical protein
MLFDVASPVLMKCWCCVCSICEARCGVCGTHCEYVLGRITDYNLDHGLALVTGSPDGHTSRLTAL